MSTLRRAVALLATLALTPLAHAQPSPGEPLNDLAKLKPYRTMRSSTSDPNWKDGNGDARPIPPGGTLVLADLKGPGTITHLWNTVAATDRGYSRLLVLRMYWDGETAPSVEAPLGDFFGIGHGIDEPFESIPIRVSSEGRARNCYWPMPFRKSAKITVTNEGRGPVHAFYSYVEWQKVDRLDKDVAYFHAMYRQEFPAVMGRNYLLADIVGRGHYVGTLLNWRQLSPSWPGEGDDFFFIDGEKEPSLRGTGTEDYFNDAWGFRKQDGPYYGVPVFEGMDTGNRTTAYRWHIPDPIVFTKSLRAEIEHKGVTFHPDGRVKSGFEERADDFSSVAFWYQTEPHKPYPPMAPAASRLYYDYSQVVEGESLLPNAKATEGPIERQELGGLSGGAQLWWRPSKDGQSLDVPFTIGEAGRYELLALLTQSWDYGTYRIELDGRPVGGPVDLYAPSATPAERFLGQFDLSTGRHVLTFRNAGKNPASQGYLFGLDGILPQKARRSASP